MKSLTYFAFLLTVSLASTFNTRGLLNNTLKQQFSIPVMEEKSADNYSRIISGITAERHEFPYIVGLRIFRPNRPSKLCGGSLIDRTWVLTAAHCTLGCTSVHVHIGSSIFHPPPHLVQVTRSETDIKEHSFYSGYTFVNDIAVIKIPAVQLSGTIGIVRLPQRVPELRSYVGEDTVLAGWGRTKESSPAHSNNLQHFTYKPISNEECTETYHHKIYPGKLCTATPRRAGACDGDSGGPLMVLNTTLQIGIFSFFGSRGCEGGQPNAFTRVDYYLDWIRDNTGLIV